MPDRWQAYPAGTQPAGYVHPLAVTVMDEVGIDIANQRSKSVETLRNMVFDLVITVCDDAAENCPVWLGKGRKVHIGFVDPVDANGSLEEKLLIFRQVRDEMRVRVLSYLKTMNVTVQSITSS